MSFGERSDIKTGVLRAAVLTGVILLLSACGTNPPAPEDHFYRLADTVPAVVYPRPLLPGSLSVTAFSAPAVLQSRAMTYAEAGQPLVLQQHHYHYWVEAPPRLLQQRLIRYLRAARVAPSVEAASAVRNARYQINGYLEHFEERIGKDFVQAVVGMRLELLDTVTGRVELSADNREETKPVPAGKVYDAVASLQAAVDRIFARWVKRMDEWRQP